MTDDVVSIRREDDMSIVRAAIRLTQQISRALGAGRGRRPYSERERAEILREAFQSAAGAVSHEQDCGMQDNPA